MTVSLFSEPRPAYGGIAAEGALNLLGRPDLDPLVVLVREAVQNSWDARDGSSTVSVAVNLVTLPAPAAEALRSSFLTEHPAKGLFPRGGVDAVELVRSLKEKKIRLLTIQDKGTTGLGGPIRADEPVAGEGTTDFVDLIFNIGQPPDKKLGGGSYGFGKTIAYLVSACRTVLIHTCTTHRGRAQHRLIAQGIGQHYSHKGRNYTGRHWWGNVKDDLVEPVVGRAAEDLARRIGLPPFAPNETGTTIAILQPDLSGRSPAEAANLLATSIAWNFWPKMVGQGAQEPAMRFSVMTDDGPVTVPDPRTIPPLKGYVEALDVLRDFESGAITRRDRPTFQIDEIRSERPRRALGLLVLHPVAFEQRDPADQGRDDEGEPFDAAPFDGASSHVALMRRAELVVRYRPGPPLADPLLEWMGVFRCYEDVDAHFRQAEPPTHDDWNPSFVNGAGRSAVNVALNRIREKVNGAYGAPVGAAPSSASSSPALVADALSGLISRGSGNRAVEPGPSDGGGGGGRGRRPNPVVRTVRRWFEAGGTGRNLLLVEMEITPAAASTATTVTVRAAAATADTNGTETTAPVGASVPRIVGFRRGKVLVGGDEITIADGDEGSVTVVVDQPAGVAVALDVTATAEHWETGGT